MKTVSMPTMEFYFREVPSVIRVGARSFPEAAERGTGFMMAGQPGRKTVGGAKVFD